MSAQTEEWRQVEGAPFYEVSNLGRVRSLDRIVTSKSGRSWLQRGRFMKPCPDGRGYFQVSFRINGRLTTTKIYTLVARAFLGPRPEGMEVCHNDGNSENDVVSNLRYGTHSENCWDMVRHKTHTKVIRTHCPDGHRLEMPNLKPTRWFRHGHRECLACSRGISHCRNHGCPGMRKEVSDRYYVEIMAGRAPARKAPRRAA